MINIIFYYLIFSSAVLIYGIGINNAVIISDSWKKQYFSFGKMLVTIISSSLITMLFVKYFLIPLSLIELYPVFALLIFMMISIIFEIIFREVTKSSTSDFNYSFLIVLLTLNESITLTEILLISVSSFLSFVILLPVLNTMKNQISKTTENFMRANTRSLILLIVAVLVIIICSAEVSWLNPGVLK